MSRILAPHKEQSSSVYIRVYRLPEEPCKALPHAVDGSAYIPGDNYFVPCRSGHDIAVSYDDSRPPSRVISSRRVEEAVETADYLKRCAEEGLAAAMLPSGSWLVSGRISWTGTGRANVRILQLLECWPIKQPVSRTTVARTLREAYHRFKAAQDATRD